MLQSLTVFCCDTQTQCTVCYECCQVCNDRRVGGTRMLALPMHCSLTRGQLPPHLASNPLPLMAVATPSQNNRSDIALLQQHWASTRLLGRDPCPVPVTGFSTLFCPFSCHLILPFCHPLPPFLCPSQVNSLPLITFSLSVPILPHLYPNLACLIPSPG